MGTGWCSRSVDDDCDNCDDYVDCDDFDDCDDDDEQEHLSRERVDTSCWPPSDISADITELERGGGAGALKNSAGHGHRAEEKVSVYFVQLKNQIMWQKTTLCGSHSCVCVSGMEGGGQKPSEETSKSGSKTSMVEIRF